MEQVPPSTTWNVKSNSFLVSSAARNGTGMAPPKKTPPDRYLYGIGEWYGRSFVRLSGEQRQDFARLELRPKKDRPVQPCPPRSTDTRTEKFTKAGGVCSLRLYRLDSTTGKVTVAPADDGALRTVCGQERSFTHA